MSNVCWGVPAKVLRIDGPTALVDFGGVRKETIVAASEISPGDLVIVHAGMVIGKLTMDDFLANVALYRDTLMQELLGSGLDEKTAREKAADETNKLLASLGIRGSVEDIHEAAAI